MKKQRFLKIMVGSWLLSFAQLRMEFSCTCCFWQNTECDQTKESMKANEEDLQKKRLEKKRKLRELFDEQYDDATYLDVLKEEVQKQGEV